ncbi:MAG TPA: ribosome-associated translation inhibitor RaiA [Phototrophicaceae bacterium]|nr:ribosome-associated translation inhibitor RaiA [Phototrophicaceae bacterium]
MEIVIQSRNLKVTDGLDTYVHRKLEKLDRYLPNIAEVRVELGHEHTRRGEDLSVAQITVRHQRGALLRAQETVPGEIENALNLAIDKMYRQIQRFKGKRERKGRERFSATLEELGIAEAIPNVEVDGNLQAETEAEQEAQVIRRKNVAVSAMSEDEAIEQMELLGHTFFVFFNQTVGAVNVVYKRRAGGYGVLNPQVE